MSGAEASRTPRDPAVGKFVPETFVSIGLETFVPLPTPGTWIHSVSPARNFLYLPAGTNGQVSCVLTLASTKKW
jgi:hypothetical protein